MNNARGNTTHIELSGLPDRLKELLEFISVTELLELIELYPNQKIYLGQSVERSKQLNRVLLPSSINRLIQRYGPGLLVDPMPTCRQAFINARNVSIHQQYAAGETAIQLAEQYGLSIRQVWRILEKAQQQAADMQLIKYKKNQLDMFG